MDAQEDGEDKKAPSENGEEGTKVGEKKWDEETETWEFLSERERCNNFSDLLNNEFGPNSEFQSKPMFPHRLYREIKLTSYHASMPSQSFVAHPPHPKKKF